MSIPIIKKDETTPLIKDQELVVIDIQNVNSTARRTNKAVKPAFITASGCCCCVGMTISGIFSYYCFTNDNAISPCFLSAGITI